MAGNILDGEFNGTFPSGNGRAGGDFISFFRINSPPVAQDGILATSEDTPNTGALIATDVTGEALNFSIVTNGSKGTAVIINPLTGVYSYTPNLNANGTDFFTFKATDGNADSNEATITVTIAPANDAPTAFDGSLATNEDQAATGTLAAQDVDGDPLAFSIIGNGSKGTAVIINPLTGVYSYTPNQNANGTDFFIFKATDGNGNSNIAVIEVAIAPVNDAPTVDASASPIEVKPGDSVKLNSTGSDIDGGSLTFFWDFGDGTASDVQNPIHSYASAGTYAVTVTVSDGVGAQSSASVKIIVDSDNDGDGIPDRLDDDDDNDGVPDADDLDRDGDGATNAAEVAAGTDPNAAHSVPGTIVSASEAPTARFTTSDLVGFVGIPLGFDASLSQDPESEIISYVWDFGDGSAIGFGRAISRAYASAGIYKVSLTVTNSLGLKDTTFRQVGVLEADQLGVFAGLVLYRVNWDRSKAGADSLSLVSIAHIGDLVVGPGTKVSFEIAGERYSRIPDKQLRDISDKNVIWKVKASRKRQTPGEIRVMLHVRKADLGAAFMKTCAETGEDPKEPITLSVPISLEIAGRAFEVVVPSKFHFSRKGNKGRGVGKFP